MSLKIESNYPLARLSTVRTGGSAEYFCRLDRLDQLDELLNWVQQRRLRLSVTGSGSNLLIADSGVDGLVLKLSKEMTEYRRSGDLRIQAYGGARLPSVAAFAAREGLAGLEFGVNIPGTIGGAVKMNANAYGGRLADVLEWVEVTTAEGTERRSPSSFEFSYRSSNLGDHEVVRTAMFKLQKSTPAVVKAETARLRKQRQDAQPSGIKTFGSTFKNPGKAVAEGRSAGQLLDACGCRGLSVGEARFSIKHANFVENTGQATTQQIVQLMALGRRKVYEEFGVILEPEVQTLGDVKWPSEWYLEGDQDEA